MKTLGGLLVLDVVLGLPMLMIGAHAQGVGDAATVALLSRVAMGLTVVNIVGLYAAWESMRKSSDD